jgi:hypothetical protein
MKNFKEKRKIMEDLETLLQHAHKCGYFSKSWKDDKEVQELLMKFEHDLEKASE